MGRRVFGDRCAEVRPNRRIAGAPHLLRSSPLNSSETSSHANGSAAGTSHAHTGQKPSFHESRGGSQPGIRDAVMLHDQSYLMDGRGAADERGAVRCEVGQGARVERGAA